MNVPKGPSFYTTSTSPLQSQRRVSARPPGEVGSILLFRRSTISEEILRHVALGEGLVPVAGGAGEPYEPSILCDDEASLMYNAKVGVSPLLAFARHKGKCRHGIRTTQRPIRSTDRVNSVAYDHCRKRQVLRVPDSPLTARSGRLQRRFVLVTSKHRRRAELPSKHLDRPPDAVKHWP